MRQRAGFGPRLPSVLWKKSIVAFIAFSVMSRVAAGVAAIQLWFAPA
jgi:hypothetical protein